MSFTRLDGRQPTEYRITESTYEGLHGVDGSARFCFGKTKALASVSGPIEVRLSAEQASKATLEVITRPLAGLTGTESKTLANTIRTAILPSLLLTKNPRTLIQIVVQALTSSHTIYENRAPGHLRSGPSHVAASINAATLALLKSSSVPLCGVVIALAVGRDRGSGELILDPSEEELQFLDGSGTFAFLISGRNVEAKPKESTPKTELVFSNWNAAPFVEEELSRAIELARVAALELHDSFRRAIAVMVLDPPPEEEDKTEGDGIVKQELIDDDVMEVS